MSALNPQTLPDIPTFQVIDNHITVQEAATNTGYNAQYLRRRLRARKLEAIKVVRSGWLTWHRCKLTLVAIYVPMTSGVDQKVPGNRHFKKMLLPLFSVLT